MLSTEQMEQFLRDGVLVVENVLSNSEVEKAIQGLHETLSNHGVQSPTIEDEESARALQKLSSTNGSGGVLDLFYEDWKMDISTNENLLEMTQDLWKIAYSRRVEDDEGSLWWHPYGSFDTKHGLPTKTAEKFGEKINGERKKKARSIQRSLTPHLDCCPETMFQNTAKWRPIQCFVSLTDNLEANTGGFEAAKGFHREFQQWAKNRPSTIATHKNKDGSRTEIAIPAACVGEYTHIRPKEERAIMDRVYHVPVRRGSAVFWDNRIPHANAYKHNGTIPRTVVYCSFLPDVDLNRRYIENQLKHFQLSQPVTDQWNHIASKDDASGDKNKNVPRSYTFSSLGRKLVGIDSWD